MCIHCTCYHRGYLKQLQLACLPGQKKEDSSSKGRSLPSLSVEGLATVLDVCCQLEQESCRGVLVYITSEETPTEATVSSAALLLIRKFQVCVLVMLCSIHCVVYTV